MKQHFGFFHHLYKTSLVGLGSFSLFGSSLAWGQTETTDIIIDAPPPVVAPQPVAPATPKLSAPKVSITTPPPQPVAPAQPQATIAPPPQPAVTLEGKNSYIDTQTYSPPKPNPQPTVVVESGGGCQTIVTNGQLQSGSCGNIVRQPEQVPVATSSPAHRQLSAAPSTRTVASRTLTRRRGNTTVVAPQKVTQSPADHRANWSRLYSLPRKESVVNTALLFPVSIPATITSVFGWRIHPITGNRKMHSGTDIGAPLGTPVLAAYPGEVATADHLGGYGLTVILRHEEGSQESRYAHLSEILVQPGEWVDQGTIIGRVGSTGNSTGPHLHFEWRYLTASGWVAVDAGNHLEAAMANLLRRMQVVQSLPQN